MRVYPKETVTTIRKDTDDLESHLLWLMSLTPRQALSVVKFLGDLHRPVGRPNVLLKDLVRYFIRRASYEEVYTIY